MSHHDKPLTLLGDLTPADFLANYWQQKPLLIRGAIPDFVSPIDPDELAGLACEPGVEGCISIAQYSVPAFSRP